MYIAPNSTIELFKNLKLDNSYANTMWFANASAQNTFFVNHRFTQLNNYSYQRKDIGVIRVEGAVSSLYDVNYLRFKNTSFENKWFYAFVTRVEYVNNATVNMYYAIDVIQTYMFDWQLQQCLVERQHSTTDVAGDNLIPEGLELGDYIIDYHSTLWAFEYYSYLIAVGCDSTWFNTISSSTTPKYCTRSMHVGKTNGLYSGVGFFIIDPIDSTSLGYLLDRLNTDHMIDAITSITMIPTTFGFGSDPIATTVTVTKPVVLAEQYAPVNKKLLTYPYCYFDVYNDQCEHQEFRYELFSGSSFIFDRYSIISSTPEAIIYPRNYNNTTKNPDYSLSVSGFPQISYYNDAYKAWQALNYDQMAVSREIAAQQNQFNQQGIDIAQRQLGTNTALNAISSGASALGSILQGNLLGAVSGGVGVASSVLNASYESQKNDLSRERSEYDVYALQLRQSAEESRAKKLANTPHAGSSSTAVATETKGFYCNYISIRKQYAERIDKYFTMFGYAQNIVAVPNIHARQYFTYVKTTGSCVSGSIPQDDRETIDTIFDRGIRFWTNYDYFENYTVNNAII